MSDCVIAVVKWAPSRFKIATVAVCATAVALLLSQIHLAYVIANEVAVCHSSATPHGLLLYHAGFAWPWLALLAFQGFGLATSRFFWLSCAAGTVAIVWASNQFETMFVGVDTIPKWECTDWSWYDETFLDRFLAWLVLKPLLVLFGLSGAARVLLALAVRAHPDSSALANVAHLLDGAPRPFPPKQKPPAGPGATS